MQYDTMSQEAPKTDIKNIL